MTLYQIVTEHGRVIEVWGDSPHGAIIQAKMDGTLYDVDDGDQHTVTVVDIDHGVSFEIKVSIP